MAPWRSPPRSHEPVRREPVRRASVQRASVQRAVAATRVRRLIAPPCEYQRIHQIAVNPKKQLFPR
jgi:hypothetical protein